MINTGSLFAATTKQQTTSMWLTWVFLAIVLGVFLFIQFRSQRKHVQERDQMVSTLQKGDEMNPGQRVVVERDIVVSGNTALCAGDEVIIQKVLRGGLDSDEKYAVYSKALEQLVWVDSQELTCAGPISEKEPGLSP